MIPNGTLVRTTSAPLSSVLCNRVGVVLERYSPPGSLPDLNEYLVYLERTPEYPVESYYIARKFLEVVVP